MQTDISHYPSYHFTQTGSPCIKKTWEIHHQIHYNMSKDIFPSPLKSLSPFNLFFSHSGRSSSATLQRVCKLWGRDNSVLCISKEIAGEHLNVVLAKLQLNFKKCTEKGRKRLYQLPRQGSRWERTEPLQGHTEQVAACL